jgi:hypothetical protein
LEISWRSQEAKYGGKKLVKWICSFTNLMLLISVIDKQFRLRFLKHNEAE